MSLYLPTSFPTTTCLINAILYLIQITPPFNIFLAPISPTPMLNKSDIRSYRSIPSPPNPRTQTTPSPLTVTKRSSDSTICLFARIHILITVSLLYYCSKFICFMLGVSELSGKTKGLTSRINGLLITHRL